MKKAILLACVAVVTGLLLFSPGQARNPALAANTLSIHPSDDAFVWSGNPGGNYGSANLLNVRNAANETYHTYLKFAVQGLDAPVHEATLYLYAQRNSNSTLSVYLVSNNYAGNNQPWQEDQLTWQNAPALGGTPLAFLDRVRDGSWVAFDVTAAVNGNATYSFALANSSANTAEFTAKEAASNRPYMVITAEESGGSGAPSPTATTTSPPTATTAPPTATPLPTATATPPPPPTATPAPGPGGGIWLSAAEIASLPVSGAAWNNVLNAAQRNTSQPNISDQNDQTDVDVLAKALVYARTGDARYRNEVVAGIMAAIGSEGDATTGILAVGRNTMPYVLAADLVNLSANPAEDQIFRAWLAGLRHFVFSGGGGSHSLISCHERRPNNFGTHCGASRIAIALYLGDQTDLDRAATVFRGWLGDRNAYTGFSFGDLSWQCNSNQPVGINPAGCTKNGHSIDGVLPDDQRRGGTFTWPPPKENYVWEGLQGAVAQAQLLHRAGYPAWEWQDQALLRAVTWLHVQADFPAEDDDRWQPWLVNYAYGTSFPAPSPTSPGKGMAWTDWSQGR
jgi:hypothetical protein